jgi:hypothetical protein
MPVFTPPTPIFVPVVSPNVPKYQQRPFAYFRPSIPRGSNVWVNTNNLISEIQPAVWQEQKIYDYEGNLVSVTPGVKKVYYGGRSYEITDTEAMELTAAGYGANIVY